MEIVCPINQSFKTQTGTSTGLVPVHCTCPFKKRASLWQRATSNLRSLSASNSQQLATERTTSTQYINCLALTSSPQHQIDSLKTLSIMTILMAQDQGKPIKEDFLPELWTRLMILMEQGPSQDTDLEQETFPSIKCVTEMWLILTQNLQEVWTL